jgi:hypothetical protein
MCVSPMLTAAVLMVLMVLGAWLWVRLSLRT